MAAYVRWMYTQIRNQAGLDEARPADCIVVLGAAQYNGRPSPVLKARLDHTVFLYRRGMADRIITTGGYGRDKKYNEASAAKEYLVKMGVPARDIEVDPWGETTYQTVQSVKAQMAGEGLKSCIIVSDGFHLLRSKRLFEREGIVAYGSPTPTSPIENSREGRFWHSLREVVVFTAYKLGILI